MPDTILTFDDLLAHIEEKTHAYEERKSVLEAMTNPENEYETIIKGLALEVVLTTAERRNQVFQTIINGVQAELNDLENDIKALALQITTIP